MKLFSMFRRDNVAAKIHTQIISEEVCCEQWWNEFSIFLSQLDYPRWRTKNFPNTECFFSFL